MSRTAVYFAKVAREFADRVVAELEGQVHSVVLYGSVARGEATRASDIDLLLVVDEPSRSRDRIAAIEVDVGSRHDYRALLTSIPLGREELRDLAGCGSPFARNVLAEGRALYDDGTFARLQQEFLKNGELIMTADPSSDFAARSLATADEMLADARLMLGHGRLRSAADRAYYAMYHAAVAVLWREVDRLPRTHHGVHVLFTSHLAATGRVPETLGGDLARAFDMRQTGSYEVDAAFREEDVQQIMAKAEVFVATMKELASGHRPAG